MLSYRVHPVPHRSTPVPSGTKPQSLLALQPLAAQVRGLLTENMRGLNRAQIRGFITAQVKGLMTT